MRTKLKTASDFGISLTGTQLEEFNNKYKKDFYNKSSLRSKVLTVLASLGMAGISIWLSAANISNPLSMAILMLLPITGIALSVFSLFEKNKEIGSQLLNAVTLAMFLVLMNTFIFVRGSEDLLLYITFSALTLLGLLFGLRGWSKMLMKRLTKNEEKEQSKPNYALISLIGVCTVPVIRAFQKQRALLFVMLVITMALMCSMLGYAIGIAAGNMRYMRYLDSRSDNN